LLGARGREITEEQPLLDDGGIPRYIVNPRGVASIGRPCPISYVIFPVMQSGQRAELQPLPRVEALVELAHLAIVYHPDPAWKGRSVDALLALVRQAPCYRLLLGRIGTNGEVIRSLLSGENKGGIPKASNSDDIGFLDVVSERIRQLLPEEEY